MLAYRNPSDRIPKGFRNTPKLCAYVNEIASRETAGDFPLSGDSFREMSLRYTAMCLAIVDILDGASYLFGVEKPKSSSVLDKQERLQQLLETLDFDYQDGDV